MKQIGRKIYYDKATGNVLVTTAEMAGDVVETTVGQDFVTYTMLHGIDPTTVGVVQCTYGQDSDKFGIYDYHIAPATNTIVWTAAIGATLEQVQAFKKTELSAAIASKIITGYQSTLVLASTGKSYLYGTTLEDQQNMIASRVWSDNNTTQPVGYRPSGSVGRIDHTRAEFVQITDIIFNRTNWYLDQADVYIPQIYSSSATIDSVNAIVITIQDPSN